jgi:two-component system sensor histidine kinase HydH
MESDVPKLRLVTGIERLSGRSLVLRLALPLLSIVLPLLVVLGALRTVHGLEREKEAFLRSRAATIAAWLETLESPEQLAGARGRLIEEDPALVGVALFDAGDPASGAPAALLEGKRLFDIGRVTVDGQQVFRVWLPCHIGNSLRLVRLDLAEEAAASLIRPAQQNVWVASLGALGLIALSLALAWSVRRTARAEQRQLELEHLAQIGQMSAALAHEIRNPLGTIKGFAQLLAERLDDDKAALLEPVLSETTRLENLVRDLLLYGRPPQVNYREIHAPDLAAVIAAHAAAWIGQRPVQFHVEAPSFRFVSDPEVLEQALLNLVKNAIEAVESSPEGQVWLEFAVRDSWIAITVSDNGPGLSEEIRRHLFEPFRTTKASGTGLGLAITRKLVNSLGGRLAVCAGRQGGVQAQIRLPLRADDDDSRNPRRG